MNSDTRFKTLRKSNKTELKIDTNKARITLTFKIKYLWLKYQIRKAEQIQNPIFLLIKYLIEIEFNVRS